MTGRGEGGITDSLYLCKNINLIWNTRLESIFCVITTCVIQCRRNRIVQYIVLEYNTVYCSTIHITTTHCSTLYITKTHDSTLHINTIHCSTLHITITHCSTLHINTTHCSALYITTTHFSALQTTRIKLEYTTHQYKHCR